MTQSLNFKRIGLFYHPKLPQSRVMAADMLEFLEDFRVTVWVSESWNEVNISHKIKNTDLLITLGGDGSMLRAARIAWQYEIPVLGVNLGKVGFLTEIEPSEWMEKFELMLTGSYQIEKRLVIQAACYRNKHLLGQYQALNDFAVNRVGLARVIRLATFINDSYLTTYTADGMVISTPTGSTGYALAAGGPILPPELKNFLLIPVAPHLCLERAIVLSPGDNIKLVINSDYHAVLTADGQVDVELRHNDTVEVSASSQISRFLRFEKNTYFYKSLMERLGLPHK